MNRNKSESKEAFCFAQNVQNKNTAAEIHTMYINTYVRLIKNTDITEIAYVVNVVTNNMRQDKWLPCLVILPM